MKITILNGNPDGANAGFEAYLANLETALQGGGHGVEILKLREIDLRACTGCFGCWVKTPGECITPDAGPRLRQAVIASDFALLAAPMRMGFPDGLLKRAMDKFIPLIHPYFAVANGEAHHRKRYPRYPVLGLLAQPEPGTDAADLKITSDIFRRTALNFKSYLAFAELTTRPAGELAELIASGARSWKHPPAPALATHVGQIAPPARLTVFNGSPRGQKGNTPLLFGHFLEGFCAGDSGRSYAMYDLNRQKESQRFVTAFEEAECVFLGFPLYTDAMPGIVKEFIDRLEPFCGRSNNPPIGFLVQSGFPEALHSRYVEQYAQKLAARLGSPYLGTIVKGGAEGIQIMPESMTHGLYDSLRQLGQTFSASGQLDAQLLKTISGRERYPFYMAPLFQAISLTGMLNFYWDQQLKENGAFERRFARPYRQS